MCILSLWTQALCRENEGAGGLIGGKKTDLKARLMWSQHYIAL